MSFVGEITGDGRVVLVDDRPGQDAGHIEVPFDLPLDLVLGAMPRKIFKSDRAVPKLQGLELPADLTVPDALDRVLRLLSVGSKRFLTNKVDRSVTGLIAQQQCVGPLHTPLAVRGGRRGKRVGDPNMVVVLNPSQTHTPNRMWL